MMTKAAAVDVGELARFILTGLAATLGNIVAVWLIRFYQPFEVALLVGIAAGMTISFVLSKWFAFGSRSWDRARGEAGRFLVVYTVSCATYWVVAVVTKRLIHDYGLTTAVEEGIAITIAAGAMTFISYFGHRFFTYRTYKREVGSIGAGS